jgi:hypothetical protein
VTRTGVVVAIGLSLSLLASPSAYAWSNGVDGYDSFGTHDWILREAIRALGDDASWVCVGVSLRATDDPDSLDGIDLASGTWWHVWDEWGVATWGGGPEAVAFWFDRVRHRLEQGDRCSASRALGIMAHLAGDMAQPMHTDGTSAHEHSAHPAYEHAVDERCTATSCRYEMHFNGRNIVEPYADALATARDAHPFYLRLINAYWAHGYNHVVDQITRRQLDRAANVMADLLWTLRHVTSASDSSSRADTLRSHHGTR